MLGAVDPVPTLDDLARRQAGTVSRGQLVAAGWSPDRVDRARAAGRLIPVARGVYRVDGAPFTRRAAHHAALLVVGDGAVLARWTAAALHDVADRRRGPVDVLALHPKRTPKGCQDLLRLRRTRNLPPEERCLVRGLPTTSGARTVLDLAPTTSTARLAELIATAVRVGACTLDDLDRVLARHPGAEGRARVTGALDLLAGDGASTRSAVEVAALRRLLEAGLPRPVLAHRVTDADGHVLAEVDLAYPARRLGIEIDGFRWHHTPAQKHADEQRQNRLVLSGWTILRFSANEVRARGDAVTAAVAQALAATSSS